MATREGEERFQVPMLEALGREMRRLAIEFEPLVERDRKLERGPMVACVARWFYSLPIAEQARIVQAGHALDVVDRRAGFVPKPAAEMTLAGSCQDAELIDSVPTPKDIEGPLPSATGVGVGRRVNKPETNRKRASKTE